MRSQEVGVVMSTTVKKSKHLLLQSIGREMRKNENTTFKVTWSFIIKKYKSGQT